MPELNIQAGLNNKVESKNYHIIVSDTPSCQAVPQQLRLFQTTFRVKPADLQE